MGQVNAAVSWDVLEVFRYGFYAMGLILAVYVGVRLRLRSDGLSARERLSAHRWCISLAVAMSTYFVSLGIVTKEVPTLALGFLLPFTFALFDLRSMSGLRELAAIDAVDELALKKLMEEVRRERAA